MSPPVTIIGMGMSPVDLTESQKRTLAAADLVVGGRRHLESFPEFGARTRIIDGHLKVLADVLRGRGPEEKVVVLASGDPLFFGIGSYLINALGRDEVIVSPNVSALAAAFARIKVPWQDARVLSLHGRTPTAGKLAQLERHPKWAVFTDPQHGPAWLARRLAEAGLIDFDFWVLSRMGTPEERVVCLDVATATSHEAPEPNLVVLLRRETQDALQDRPAPYHLGLPEAAFDCEAGLITKSEVRAVALAKLELVPDADLTVWDLGAGSGSLAVEAARLVPQGRVVAVEQKATRTVRIEKNRQKFGCANLMVVTAALPEGLETLPDPDRIFIGGGGRDLAAIIPAAVRRLKTGGVLVINTVLLGSLTLARENLAGFGLPHQTVQIQVSRSSPMPWDERLAPQTPVWIIQARKAF
ncbi:MAG: precorrin-6y C5,15-methyltransferase (decarboxylating) subunit CbiE [Desulfosarcinaceae bacterium]|jgi:precorrin-6Y C5,15-methyltransferase (decarboxylating)